MAIWNRKNVEMGGERGIEKAENGTAEVVAETTSPRIENESTELTRALKARQVTMIAIGGEILLL